MPPAMIDIKVTKEMDGDIGDGNSMELTSVACREDMKGHVAHV